MKFSESFSSVTDFSEYPKNLSEFYKSYITQIKKSKIPIKQFKTLSINPNTKKVEHFEFNNIFDNFPINLHSVSSSAKEGIQSPLVLILPDYQANTFLHRPFYKLNYKQYILEPREQKINIQHSKFLQKNHPPKDIDSIQKFSNDCKKVEEHYMFQLYMDSYHAIHTIKRSITEPQKQPIYLFGQGTGANTALFLAAFDRNVKKVFIDSPRYNNLNLQLKHSEASYIKEIRTLLKNTKSPSLLKIIHTYLDSSYFMPYIKQKIGMHLTLPDPESLSKANFALFHTCSSPKEMFISTGEIGADKQQYLFNSAKTFFQEENSL